MTKNPQLEDGYTRIANQIMDALPRIRIPGEARQILDTIFRKTYGFNKKEDDISLSQFTKTTGLSKVAVCKAIIKLVAMNIITKKGNGSGVTYGVLPNAEWKPLPKKVTLPKKVISITQEGNNRYPKRYTQKTVLKNNSKDIRPNSEEFGLAKLLFDLILIRNPGHKRPDLQTWAGHVDSMIRLDNRKVDDIEAVIRWCQSNKSAASRFWNNNILSTEKLREQFDQLWMKMPDKARGSRNNGSINTPKKSLDEQLAERNKKEGVIKT